MRNFNLWSLAMDYKRHAVVATEMMGGDDQETGITAISNPYGNPKREVPWRSIWFVGFSDPWRVVQYVPVAPATIFVRMRPNRDQPYSCQPAHVDKL
jgi:hypothetical protein